MKQALSAAEFARFMAEKAPVWAFDVGAQRMLWANKAALAFWHADKESEFLKRDYSSDSRAVRERLEQTMNAAMDGTWTRGSWTLFPKDIPTTVLLDARSYNIDGTDQAIVFRIARELDFAAADPDGLRMMVSARTTTVGASVFDLAGNLISENPASLALRHKYPHWGQTAINLRTRYNSEAIAARIFAAIEQDSIETFEFSLDNKGEVQILSVTAKRIRDPVSGDPVAHITEEDITEKETLAKSLSKLNDELEARVAKRTRELEQVNERLRRSQKLETLGKLTGGIAHDFNNLLAVVQGNAELMQLTGTYQEDLIQEITTATTRGADLTRALLAYARKQPLRAGPVDLRETIHAIRNILERTLGEHIELSVYAPQDVWIAHVDEGQIKDAVLNLALNARDAMEQGGHIRFELANRPAHANPTSPELQGDFVELAVIDTGTGMSPDVLSKATDPFFTTKPVGQGSGLGLSMVYGFAHQSGGNMTIRSQPGVGTTIKLYFPRHKDVQAEISDRPEIADVPPGRGELILLVEDDDAVRRMMVRALQALGYRVTDFDLARSALAHLNAGYKADLLLTDVILPDGMNGPALAAQVKCRFPTLKTLFMSGYTDQMPPGHDTLGKGDVLVNKPVKYDVLAKAIRSVLDRP